LTLGAKSPEGERAAFHPEACLVALRQRGNRGRFVGKVHNSVTLAADEVDMMLGVDIVPGHLVQGIDLDEQTLLTEYLESLVHGVKGDSRHLPADFLINLVGSGMIPPGF